MKFVFQESVVIQGEACILNAPEGGVLLSLLFFTLGEVGRGLAAGGLLV